MMKDNGKRKGQNTSTHKNPEKGLKLETPKTERKKNQRSSKQQNYTQKEKEKENDTQDTNKRR